MTQEASSKAAVANAEAEALGDELRDLGAQLAATDKELISSRDQVRHSRSVLHGTEFALPRSECSDGTIIWQVREVSAQQDAIAERLRVCATERLQYADAAAAGRMELAGLTLDVQMLRHAQSPDYLTLVKVW